MKRSAAYSDSAPTKYVRRTVLRTGPSGESYNVKAKASRLSTKNLGVSRIWNLLCPSFKIKQTNYFPRIAPYFSANDTGNSQLNEVTELKVIQAPVAGQSFTEIPHMSCFEWTMLAQKCVDNSLLNYAQHNVLTGNFNKVQNKQCMVEYCKYNYTIENCQLWDCYVEIIEIQPRHPIMDLLQRTETSAASPNILNGLGSTPLGCKYKDFLEQKSLGNVEYPRDDLYSASRATAEATIGYNPYGACFHKNYRILKKKVFKLGPGSNINYQLAIPAFKGKSDFNTDVMHFGVPSTVFEYSLSPSMWQNSRWLLIRTWSGKVSSKADTTAFGLGDTKLKICCSRFLKMRPVPEIDPATIVAGPTSGVDAFGTMNGSSSLLAVQDINVAVIEEDSDDRVVFATAAEAST